MSTLPLIHRLNLNFLLELKRTDILLDLWICHLTLSVISIGHNTFLVTPKYSYLLLQASYLSEFADKLRIDSHTERQGQEEWIHT